MPICDLTFEGGGLRNRDIAEGAAVAADKVIQHYAVSELLTATPTTTVTALTVPLHIVWSDSAEIMGFDACVFTAATGDYACSVDLQKSTGGGAFATVLNAPVEFDNSVSARTILTAVINDETLTEDDILQAVVTLDTGSSGTHAAGMLVSVILQDRLA